MRGLSRDLRPLHQVDQDIKGLINKTRDGKLERRHTDGRVAKRSAESPISHHHLCKAIDLVLPHPRSPSPQLAYASAAPSAKRQHERLDLRARDGVIHARPQSVDMVFVNEFLDDDTTVCLWRCTWLFLARHGASPPPAFDIFPLHPHLVFVAAPAAGLAQRLQDEEPKLSSLSHPIDFILPAHSIKLVPLSTDTCARQAQAEPLDELASAERDERGGLVEL